MITGRFGDYSDTSENRGLPECASADMIIRVYVDAAYGVHIHDGKSHSGAYTVLGAGGPLEAKSGNQKNFTKSSTEAELVALSNHADRGINLRNFLAGQG